MKRTITGAAGFRPHALALATSVALGGASSAHAVSFNVGEIEGRFDSTLSIG